MRMFFDIMEKWLNHVVSILDFCINVTLDTLNSKC